MSKVKTDRELLLRAAALLSERAPCADPECRVADDGAVMRCINDLSAATRDRSLAEAQSNGRPTVERSIKEIKHAAAASYWRDLFVSRLRALLTVGATPSQGPSVTAVERCRLLDELIQSWHEKGNEPEQRERRIRARAAVEAAWPVGVDVPGEGKSNG